MACYITCYMTSAQVEEVEKKLKHKLRPYNAYLKALGLDCLAASPREELHQFLIRLHGDYIITPILYEDKKVLCRPNLVTSKPGAQAVTHLIRLAGVWARLRDRLSAVDL